MFDTTLSPLDPVSERAEESELNVIALQEAAARSLREQMIPTDVYIATHTAGNGRLSVYSYGRSTILDTGVWEASLQAGSLSGAVEQVNAGYLRQKSALEMRFSGEELDRQAEALEKSRLESQTAAAASFAQLVGGFLDSHGLGDETRRVYESAQAVFSAAHQSSQAYYTLREMDFAAFAVSAYQSVIHKARQGSEVRQAVQMAMVDMKVERMAMHGGTGGLPDALRQARPEIHRELLDAMDAYFAGCREREDPSRFPDADRGLFSAAYETILHSFRMSGDALTAASVGAEVAKPLLNEAMGQCPAQRWIDELEEGGFWDTFYYPAYRGGMYETLAADWQGFLYRYETAAGLNAAG